MTDWGVEGVVRCSVMIISVIKAEDGRDRESMEEREKVTAKYTSYPLHEYSDLLGPSQWRPSHCLLASFFSLHTPSSPLSSHGVTEGERENHANKLSLATV